jgi:acyl-CoA oxidase
VLRNKGSDSDVNPENEICTLLILQNRRLDFGPSILEITKKSNPPENECYFLSTRDSTAMQAGGMPRVAETPQQENAIRQAESGRICSTSLAEGDTWGRKFRAMAADLFADIPRHGSSGFPAHASAGKMRELCKSQILRLTDLRDQPERFFSAHRILSDEWSHRIGPGIGIRFTVQFNLFAGTVLALGTDEQVKQLDALQEQGVLGCFALTERLAGVHSGLVVMMTATFDAARRKFVLETPHDGAVKTWISQGRTAEWCVLIADLVVGGTSRGAHAFLFELRRSDGTLINGASMGDAAEKTIGQDLDNVWLRFDSSEIVESALLGRFGHIDASGQYTSLAPAGTRHLELVGQRLFSGRAVIAESALCFARALFARTRVYAEHRRCWSPSTSRPALAALPHLAALFEEADATLSELDTFVRRVQAALMPSMRDGLPPPREVAEAVAVAKVCCVEAAADLCGRLRNEVGSYALTAESGFGMIDYLLCCRYAEGDSRVLMQKLARDRISAFTRAPLRGVEAENRLASQVLVQLYASGAPCRSRRCGPGDTASDPEALAREQKLHAWNGAWQLTYALAGLVGRRTVTEWTAADAGAGRNGRGRHTAPASVRSWVHGCISVVRNWQWWCRFSTWWLWRGRLALIKR